MSRPEWERGARGIWRRIGGRPELIGREGVWPRSALLGQTPLRRQNCRRKAMSSQDLRRRWIWPSFAAQLGQTPLLAKSPAAGVPREHFWFPSAGCVERQLMMPPVREPGSEEEGRWRSE